MLLTVTPLSSSLTISLMMPSIQISGLSARGTLLFQGVSSPSQEEAQEGLLMAIQPTPVFHSARMLFSALWQKTLLVMLSSKPGPGCVSLTPLMIGAEIIRDLITTLFVMSVRMRE